MSTNFTGLQAYNNALNNFNDIESDVKSATTYGGSQSVSFANVLDQTLLRDSVDRAENFGANADFIKSRVQETLPVANANDFSDTMSESFNRVKALQSQKEAAITDFASGRNQNVHELMVTLQKASVAMSLTSAVRGKVMEAYKELSRIQF